MIEIPNVGDEVQITESNHSLDGAFARVSGKAGDLDSFGDPIPDGWVQLQIDDQHHELFKETDIVPAHSFL